MPRLVWLSEVQFAGPPHRQVHLARALSDRFDVLFVEPPRSLRPPRARLECHDRVLVGQAAPLLNARPRALRVALGEPRLRRLAGVLGTAQIRRALRLAGWSTARRDMIFVCSNVFFADAFEALAGCARVLDICDDPRFYPGEPAWTDGLLRRCLRVADLVTTSSMALQSEFGALGARRVEYVSNGIAEALLAPLPRKHGQPPTVGFLGYIGPWVDLALLGRLADALPDARMVLVGPVDPAQADALARLERLKNVEYRGAVEAGHAACTIAGFDVGLIPFTCTPYTRAVNPLKLYEYAAQDVPVVSTSFSPDVMRFGDAVSVCASVDEFVQATRDALEQGKRPLRWIAEAHTWPALAAQFAQLVENAT